jgi:starch-binding outer membrane protein SusE/F
LRKVENKVVFEGGTTPVLSASTTTPVLAFAQALNPSLSLSWTNPNYRYNTGISSAAVTYLLEMDLQGANFGSARKKVFSLSPDVMKGFTVGEFNDVLLNDLQLTPGMAATIQARVISTINGTAGRLISNVINLNVTPYAIPPKVTPPASLKLYITGAATPASWMNGGDPEVVAQRFTRISNTLYELPSLNINGGNSFLFVPVYGDWSNKFGFTGAGNMNNPDGDDFRDGGNDFKAPAVSGAYKITVDFQRGKYTFTKL